MKKNFTPFLMFILILINRVNFSQFELRYPDIPQDQINDIIFLNESKGFFVNDGGSVLMTEDGGVTWKIKAHFQRNSFSEIKFIDTQNGFAISPHTHIGDDVSFIFTTDGGTSWEDADAYMGDALTFLPVSISVLLKSSIYEGNISKLDNFFGNWIETYRMPYFFDDDVFVPYGDILQMQNLPGGAILALGSSWRAKNANFISDSVSFILKSNDSGSTWDTLWCGLSYSALTFIFADNNIGWLGAEQNRIYKTTDGGVSWLLQYSDTLQDFSIKSVSSPDGINIFAVDGSGKVIFSTNGGSDWQIVQVSQAFDFQFNIKFLNATKGFLSGYDIDGYDLWITNNGGINWERVSKSLKGYFRKIDFADEYIGMGVGENYIYKTLDGGYSWNIIHGSLSQSFSDLDLLDSLLVWVVGYDTLFKSSDGGNTWISFKLSNNIQYMRGIQFLDQNVGVVFEVWENDSTFNYVTTDGGQTWNKYPINDNQFITSYNKIKFSDPGHLWFANQSGVWLSKDTAKSWELFELDGSFLAFDFIDSLYGWVSLWEGQHNEMVYTSDGGLNWTTVNKPYSFQTEDVLIFKEGNYFGGLHTFVAGYDGSLIKYRQGDNFIVKMPTYTRNPLLSFASYRKGNSFNIWAAGYGMTVLHTQYFVTDIKEKKGDETLDFHLSQNYPNPFNPMTIIRFSVSSRQLVNLKIYDVLGKEVATLVNEEKQPGVYEAQFDANNFSSGIYYYQLKAGDFIETKKMIYLK